MGRTKNQPEGGQAPVVQRVRLRYAKRGRLRFTSHRDFARAFERAIQRAGVPIAYSQGFTPHPKVSYASAAPTGVASEAEYLEIGLRERVDVALLARALDAALSPGLDVLEAVEARTGALSDRIDVGSWRIELPGLEVAALRAAVDAFLAASEVPVERMTKQGRRAFDARAAVVCAVVSATGAEPTAASGPEPTAASGAEPTAASGAEPTAASGAEPTAASGAEPTAASGAETGDVAAREAGVAQCAILDLVVRLVSPTVRPDDVLSGLRVVAGLEPPAPARATRLAQGTLTMQGEIVDPLAADRPQDVIGAPSA